MVATSIFTTIALAGLAAAAPVSQGSPPIGVSPAPLRVVDTDLCLDNAHAITDIGNPINGWPCQGPLEKKQGWLRKGRKFALAGVDDRCIGVRNDLKLVLASCSNPANNIITTEFAFNKGKSGSTPTEGSRMCISARQNDGGPVYETCVNAPVQGWQVGLEEHVQGYHTRIAWEDPAAATYSDPSVV